MQQIVLNFQGRRRYLLKKGLREVITGKFKKLIHVYFFILLSYVVVKETLDFELILNANSWCMSICCFSFVSFFKETLTFELWLMHIYLIRFIINYMIVRISFWIYLFRKSFRYLALLATANIFLKKHTAYLNQLLGIMSEEINLYLLFMNRLCH